MNTPTPTPQLELFDFRPWFPAGSYTSFGLRLKPQGLAIERVSIHMSGRLSDEGDSQLDLDYVEDTRCFEDYFECLSPQAGGMVRARLMVECHSPDGTRHRFKGSTGIPLISNHWHDDVVRRNLQGLVVELRNKGGLLRQEGRIDTPIDKLIVDTEEGITRLKGDIESGGILSWLVRLSFVDSVKATEPERVDSACLRFLHGHSAQCTRVFARNQIRLGRPMMETTDLWLSVHPMDDPENRRPMDRMSSPHASIRWNGDGFQIRDAKPSRLGIWLNDQRLGESWTELRHGDGLQIQRPAAFGLAVYDLGGGALRLERTGNGVEEEDYLLLPPNTALNTDGGRPGISHQRGGLLLHPQKDGTRINGQAVSKRMPVELKNGDLVECGDMAFLFQSGAYPAG